MTWFRRLAVPLILLFCFIVHVPAASAQQRPLVTEDPETIGAGRILIEGGVSLERDVFYPVSGLRGRRFAGPTIGVSIGVSSIAEIQIDGGFHQALDVTERRAAPLSDLLDFEGTHTRDIEDLVIGMKVRLFGETPARPSMGIRFATKLPNASNESGLGTDMTDVAASVLIAKTVQSIRVVGNAGVTILGDPTSPVPEQNDLITFGVSIARALTDAVELVGEINGRFNVADAPHPGAENRAVMRFGGRYTFRTVRLDTGVVIGMTSRDPEIGGTLGFTWVFDAFRVP